MVDFLLFLTGNQQLVLTAVMEHIIISFTALFLGILVAFPTGVVLSLRRRAAGPVLAVFSVVNTLPSLVLLGVAMIALGVGFWPAVAVLFLYSLLPIMRNTYTGIREVDDKYVKAARGMGMSRLQILQKVQLPLALPVILAGIRMSAIYIISWATLSAFIGAGGLGDLIWMGLQSYNYSMIFAGAVPATVLALGVSLVLTKAESLASRLSFHEGRRGS